MAREDSWVEQPLPDLDSWTTRCTLRVLETAFGERGCLTDFKAAAIPIVHATARTIAIDY